MQIRYTAVLPTSAEGAFDFVSDPTNWPGFFRQMQAAEVLEGWGRVGGRASMVNRVLGQEIVSDLVLVEWDRPRSFAYVGRNHGRPDTENRRELEPVPGGTRLTGTTTAEPRAGARGLVDRITFVVLRHTFDRAMKQLPSHLTGP